MAVLKPAPGDAAPSNVDCFRSGGRPISEVPSPLGVSLRSQAVDVISVSADGLLFHSGCRLAHGESSHLDILHVDGPRRVRGRVVRSEVVSVSPQGITYRTAFRFDSTLEGVDNDAADSPPDATDAQFAAL